MAECPPLSRIICGTMRMLEAERSVTEWVEFLVHLHAHGITTLHSSTEYDSFRLFCNVLQAFSQQYPEKRFQHVVKLAEPHFQETGFSTARLNTKVTEYCQHLQVPTIDVVQWMWRVDVEQDSKRCKDFESQASEIADAVMALKAAGKIRQFMCFPYTPDFAVQSVQYGLIDGLIAYHNRLEFEYERAFAQAAKIGKTGIAIRPFAAGKAFDSGLSAVQLLAQTLNQPGIDHVIVGLSSLTHVEAITC